MYGVSDAIYAGVRFFLIAILTRILTPSDFGTYAVIAATLQFTTVVVPLSLPTAMIVMFKENDPSRMSALKNTTMLILLQICAVLAIAFAAGSRIFFAGSVISTLAGLLVVWSVSDILGMVPRMSLRYHQKIVLFGVARIIRAIVMVGVLLGLLHILVTGLYAIVISEAVAAIAELFLACLFDRFLPRPKRLWGLSSLLGTGLPLTGVGFGMFLNDLADRYIVYLFLGGATNGFYAAAAKIALVGSFCAEAFNSMWFPYFFKFFQTKAYHEQELRDFSKKLVLLFAALIGLLCILLPHVMTFRVFGKNFISPAYQGVAYLVAPLTLVYFFKTAMYVASPILTYRNRIAKLSAITWIGAALNIVANVLWCRIFGNAHAHMALSAIAFMTSLSYGLCMVWVSRDAGLFNLRTWFFSPLAVFSAVLLAPAFIPVPLYCKLAIWAVAAAVLYKRQFAGSNVLARLLMGKG